ncbi:hypothetical protein HON52_01330 [Candidatus Uhrbacteria bacterium]|jgi:hypothetical protein|nr:hypothetical protein [Candidatus Uhrbacteria bacterium]
MVLSLVKKGKWFSVGVLSLMMAGLNQLSVQNAAIGGLCLVIFLICAGALFGSRLIKDKDTLIQMGVGLSAVIALLAIGGAAIYYISIVQSWMLFVLCLLTLCIGAWMARGGSAAKEEGFNGNFLTWTALIAIIICIAAWWNAIAPIDITQAIRSVWLIADPGSIISLAIAIILSITISPFLSNRLRFALFGSILLSVWIVPTLTYSLGYGFDPFIHRTTISHIAEFGTITPKPFYYIGQYALELISSMVFSVPIYLIDAVLVPILGAILLSAAGIYGFAQTASGKGWAAISLFLLPLGVFISTTPQALAYIFTGVLILLSLPILARTEHQPPRLLLGLLAFAALITHPLAGIPACLYTLCVWVVANRHANVIQGSLLAPIATVSAIIIPAVFLIQASLSGLLISFSLQDLAWDQLNLTGFWRNQFSSIFDGLYLFIDNQLWISLVLAMAGAILLIKRHAGARIHLPLLMVVLWMINYFILTLTLQFDFLIEYERTNYAQRLLTISLLFLIPHVGFAIDGIFSILQNRARALRLGFTVLLTLTISSGIYGAFPRNDNYARSAGFNVSTTDFDAATTINDMGGDQQYIVLANQAVSAAALELYGFAQYYHEDIFYYPIPTGGELYSKYLQMADVDPTRETMIDAMDLAGVDLGFFVLNDYWWDSSRISEAAKQEADSWLRVGDSQNEITIFIFSRDQ